MSQVLRIHPDNPKIFEFRGKPRVLVCATEHYGAVLNRPFRFDRYLADAAERGQTLTRLFTLFRELQTPVNPYSTCKPESPDYVSPFLRTGPGLAGDRQPKYDLERWNPEFFERLHGFLSLADRYGIIVEVVLFSNTYSDAVWALNPLNPANNITMGEGVQIPWHDYITCRSEELMKWQCRYVEKIVEETCRYPNVFYEICNEPGAYGSGDPPGADEVNAWQSGMIDLVHRVERNTANQHLIAGQQAFFHYPDFVQPADAAFAEMDFDIVNLHPLPSTSFRGRSYDMGVFMSKQLRLAAVRDFALATYELPKPLNYDEDNTATQYKEVEGWTVHRKRAWTTLLSGAHYDMIDFSIWPRQEAGTPESRMGIRLWMGHLAEFIHSIDLVRARPLTGWLKTQPKHTLESVFAVEGEDFCVYLADEREREDPGCGDVIEGSISFDLPTGDFQVSCYSPVDGVYSPSVSIAGGDGCSLGVPAFRHDTVVRIRRA